MIENLRGFCSCHGDAGSHYMEVVEKMQAQLALSTKREEIYRKALEEIVKSPGAQFHRDIARTALDGGKERKP